MVKGSVRESGSPVLELEINGQSYPAIIDTGFEGALQLPADLFALVDPVFRVRQEYQYGDGRIESVDTFDVTVTLDGDTLVLGTLFSDSDEILLGTDALKDYRLEVNFVAGTVVLERMTP